MRAQTVKVQRGPAQTTKGVAKEQRRKEKVNQTDTVQARQTEPQTDRFQTGPTYTAPESNEKMYRNSTLYSFSENIK